MKQHIRKPINTTFHWHLLSKVAAIVFVATTLLNVGATAGGTSGHENGKETGGRRSDKVGRIEVN
jgi:hypothetical protein